LTGANALAQDIYLGDASGLSDNKAKITTVADMELTGVLSGAADAILLKNGDGTLTLSSANTYSGGTEVQAGFLVGNVDGVFGTGGMSVSDGAKLTLQGGSSNNNLDDLALLVLGSSAELAMDFTGVADTVGGISLDGGLTFLSGGTYNAAALDALGNGTYSGTGSLTVIPEPATLGLITFCFGGLWAMRRLMM
ncbi:MAG: autotransporter-associated beta strand repeat-containing protein, partial [Patescibacteria group bacterium]|nr:autotransporter-associated beta strand repeat-containing protein [Patescibacteria group bacterium]